MDISKITDTKELKAMAFDQQVIAEQAQNNIRMIMGRLQQVQQEEAKQSHTEKVEEENPAIH